MGRMPIVACACLLLAVHVPPAISGPQDDDGQVQARSGATSWHWTPREWSGSEVYTEIKGYADRPDEQTLNALSVDWQEAVLDALGNFCTVRGQIRMNDKGHTRTRPINWFQGVTVYLGTTPRAAGLVQRHGPGRHSARDGGHEPVGEVSGVFRPSQDEARSRSVQSFQFGVALARHTVRSKTSHHLDWSSRAPAVPSSVRILSIPRALRLSRKLELINRARGWPFSDPDGVALIRAVNALRSLGKERALAVLEKYVELSRNAGDIFDQDVVFWIIRVLFEPIRLDDRIPEPGIAVFLVEGKSAEALRWSLIPMTLSADIPFMVGHQIGMAGAPERPSSHIRWARLHGVIRDDPLVPTANPLAAAEAILDSRRFQALDDFARTQATMSIRSQALAMVEGLLPPTGHRENVRDDQWRVLLKAAAERGTHWDAKREQFVTRK